MRTLGGLCAGAFVVLAVPNPALAQGRLEAQYEATLSGIPVGKGTFQWDGAAGTWVWVDPENDLIFVGLIQRLSMIMEQVNPQQLTQKLLAGAIVKGG